MKILAVSGSLRRDSHNTKLLRAAEELLPAGVTFELFDGLKAVPPYDEDDDVYPAPAAVTALRDAIDEADAVLFSTPEYNSSIPGVLKNAIDWVSRPLHSTPLANKPVAVVGASTGVFGAIWAQAELRKVLGATGARVVEGEVALGRAASHFDDDGRLTDEPSREQLAEVLAELLAELKPAAAPKLLDEGPVEPRPTEPIRR
jgi:chromate reductase, NAD(P)H dehydrogenase (quinone)